MLSIIVRGVLVCLIFVSCLQSQPALTMRAIAAGESHSLALASDGTVWAWGCNGGGQLGDGSVQYRLTPVKVLGLTGATDIAGGLTTSLALKSDGTVWQWGSEPYYGCSFQTPVQTRLPAGASATPVLVTGLSGITAIAGGGLHRLALKSDGTVWAWGSNQFGNLGDGTFNAHSIPAKVNVLAGSTAITAGFSHSLAVRSDGTVWAWGNNWYGQVGNGRTDPIGPVGITQPVQVNGLTGVIAVASGSFHSLALKNDGTVWAWGHNGGGQLGDGTMEVRSTPVQVIGLQGVAAIAAGAYRSLALTSDGAVWMWGWSGYEPLAFQVTPVKISGVSGVVRIAAGGGHNLALNTDGKIWAWGLDSIGQLGDGNVLARIAPRQVPAPSGFAAIAATGDRSMALSTDGTVWQWGAEYVFAGFDFRTVPVPIQVAGISNAVAIAVGVFHSLALDSSGIVWEWNPQAPPAPMPNLTDVVRVAAGETSSVAVKTDGTVWEWTAPAAPIQVSGLNNVMTAAVAFEILWGDGVFLTRKIALERDGTVWVWDEGDQAEYRSPARVAGLDGIVAIAGGSPCLAVKDDGTVWQWDWGSPAASQYTGARGVISVQQGQGHALALRSDGTAWAWGDNRYGQLGDGLTADSTLPVQVGALNDIAAVAAGSSHSMALKKDGTVWAWGNNQSGQLGDEKTVTYKRTPVLVVPPGAPDLAIEINHSGDFQAGQKVAYQVTIRNIGATPTSGPVTVTDILPPGLTYVSSSGSGWSCSAANQTVTCVNSGPINAAASSTLSLSVDIGPQASERLTNLAFVSNGSDLNSSNDLVGDTAVVSGGGAA